jgi:hypothetical protein
VNSSPKPDHLKKAILFAIMCLFVLVSVEVTAQFLFRARYGNFVWSQGTEGFHVRSFTRLVADARHVTTIPNFSDPKYEGYGISIDTYGFRRGTQATRPDCPSVVFIGDSVPFGWGGSDRASMPSKLFARLQNANNPRCVINAAIPSYSLFQAVARFEIEILNKFKIDSVYLQIYDPVSQFVRFGAQWRPDMDWTTEPVAFVNPKREYIASIAIVRNALRHFGVLQRSGSEYFENVKPADRRSLDRYRLEIRGELERLPDLIVKANVKQLIVTPVTVPADAYERLSEGYRIAIEAINDELMQFAARHKDTSFADSIAFLKGYPVTDVFVDDCCHLSERGNDIVAEQLIKILTRK